MPVARRLTNAAEEPDWTEVIAKALAYLAVNTDDLKTRTLTERATFLMGLGLSRAEAAALLGSTDGSLKVLLLRAKKANRGRGSKRA